MKLRLVFNTFFFIWLIVSLCLINQTPIYSSPAVLTYPPDGSRNIFDQPLVFRWTSSGAPKYRIYVDDDIGFYNTLFISETINASFTYPLNPLDQRHRLSAGQVYYWKVEGIDLYGNVILKTFEPFSFSIKETALSATRDIGINSVKIAFVEPDISARVELKNYGSRAETNINITLYINNATCRRKKVNSINSGGIEYVDFVIELPESEISERTIFLSAVTDFFDDNINNNLITKSIVLPEEYFEKRLTKISGKVIEKRIDKKEKIKVIRNATVLYTGLKKGSVLTDSTGQYEIEKLPAGKYILRVISTEYYDSEEQEIVTEIGKAHTDIDFELFKKKEIVKKREEVIEKRKEKIEPVPEVIEKKTLSIGEFYDKLKPFLPDDMNIQLQGYELDKIKGIIPEELSLIIDELEKGTAKITKKKLK